MKRVVIISVILLLFTIIGWQQYQINQMKRQRAEEFAEEMQRFTWSMRKANCAEHIGKLEGPKHDAALVWFRPFHDDSHPMSEEDLKTCKEF
jgi:predicted negative regulator of RcsB-dependent stress response